MADLDPDVLKVRMAMSCVGCGGSPAPEFGVTAFDSFDCGTEVLLLSLLAGCQPEVLLVPGAAGILCPSASIFKAGCGEPPAD